jgi:hypothetical protein
MSTVAMGVPAGVISNNTDFFFTGRWKHARIAAIVDVVAEVALLGLSISVGWHFATVLDNLRAHRGEYYRRGVLLPS